MKYPYLTVAFFVFFGIIDIAILGNHYELTKSDWSGWVQAIGSIAAIIGAFWIAKNQHANERKLEKDKRRADERLRFKIVKAVFSKTFATVSLIVNEREQSDFNLPGPHRSRLLRDCQNSLDSLAPFEMPHEDLILLTTGLSHAIDILSEALDAEQSSVTEVHRLDDNAIEGIREAILAAKTLACDGLRLCQKEIDLRE